MATEGKVLTIWIEIPYFENSTSIWRHNELAGSSRVGVFGSERKRSR